MINKTLHELRKITDLPKSFKVAIVCFFDIWACFLSSSFSYYLRVGEWDVFSKGTLMPSLIAAPILLFVFFGTGVYKSVFRFSGTEPPSLLIKSVIIYSIPFALIFSFFGISGVPRTVGIIQPLILFIFISLGRFLAGKVLNTIQPIETGEKHLQRILIYGAADHGHRVASSLLNDKQIQIVGYFDDDVRLHGRLVNGVPVYDPKFLTEICENLSISGILFSSTKTSRERRSEVEAEVANISVSLHTLPSLMEVLKGKVEISNAKSWQFDELLGREAVKPTQDLLGKNINGKRVMVTGAGGSIGSEICRQIALLEPMELILLEASEFALYSIKSELANAFPEKKIISLLGSVADREHLSRIFGCYRPETVYHCAAYKHVPLVEDNVITGVKNNIFGTLACAEIAIQQRVENFVLISTDKAVRPTNFMGASKRISELILQALAAESGDTKLSMVRFGNVLGSSGSVVPKFLKQIQNGGPITVTHPEITRYFMTISEASQLVIQAGAMAIGGDVFVLDMGKPIKISELAEKTIELSGLEIKNAQNPNGDIELIFTDLRPGEKLHEELLIGNDPQMTEHPKIMKANEIFISWDKLGKELALLSDSLENYDIDGVNRIVSSLVLQNGQTYEVSDLLNLRELGCES